MKILLIEDQLKVASFISKGLTENFYTVDLSMNAEEAKKLLNVYSYDLILLDINLPGQDGLSFCKELRNSGDVTPIIMLTARTEIIDRVTGLDAGANDYLCKPFDFEELLARIRNQLNKNKVLADLLLTVDNLVLDLVKREVIRGGEKIELTSKEFALLEYLLRNKGRVVTRTSIIEHVWDMNFDSDTNLVDVFISYLRRKIDDNHENKIIKTKHGRGYIIE